MSKYTYFASVDAAYGDDKTVISYFRQRRLMWWERLLTRIFKRYKVKQPLELVDTYTIEERVKRVKT